MDQYTHILDIIGQDTFWNMLLMVLFIPAPIVMIWFAIKAVGMLIKTIKKALGIKTEEEEEEVEIHRY